MQTPSWLLPLPHDVRREYPFASKRLNWSASESYHYIDEGAGSPILCVHGNPTWSFAFRRIIREFSGSQRVLAVDHIGCGLSSKPQSYEYRLERHIENLVRFVDELDLRDITLVGHDWGGCIGMGAAVRRPERFSRFVLMNTAAFPSQRIPIRIALCRAPWLGTLGVRGLNLFSRAAMRMATERPREMSRAVKRGYLWPYRSWADRIAVDRFVKDIPLSPSHPSQRTLIEVEMGLSRFQSHPMLLIWGMRDWCFTPEFLTEFRRRFPNAQVEEVAHAGHFVFEDAADRVLAAMRDFLRAKGHDL
jgi:haloalkane dehalogenase